MNRAGATWRIGALRACVAAVLAGAIVLAPPAGRAEQAEDALAPYAERVDQAVDRALKYLASQQKDDGMFPSPLGGNTAVTGLSVMAFLARGHTPGDGPYGEVINRGIDFILDAADERGMLVGKRAHGVMYSHSIATLLLSEVSGMVDPDRQERIDEALGKGLKIILDAQAVEKPEQFRGGWRYNPNSPDSDISCSGWALMSLRSARNAGTPVPARSIARAVAFVMNCRTPDGGFAYQPGGGAGLARTGVALMSLELCGRHRGKPAVGAGEWILKHLPGSYGQTFFYYGLYYCSQGMFQLGGDYWTRYAVHMYEMMLKFQADDGSWPVGTAHEARGGACYSTAMGVLAMSVTYRQLPIYQR